MWASPFSVALMNLAGVLNERSIYYDPKDVALSWLKQETGQDFGYDLLAWERWGNEHSAFYPGWSGIAALVNPPATNPDDASESN